MDFPITISQLQPLSPFSLSTYFFLGCCWLGFVVVDQSDTFRSPVKIPQKCQQNDLAHMFTTFLVCLLLFYLLQVSGRSVPSAANQPCAGLCTVLEETTESQLISSQQNPISCSDFGGKGGRNRQYAAIIFLEVMYNKENNINACNVFFSSLHFANAILLIFSNQTLN